ncbi:meckelin-like [Eurytemora carolleeae]|uniref:meckelin-like n=1 Tax=Eurytemora carolleeae TaxID=1294199 RepID=UPI000C78C986|nr:meckelin-like [Eurytemora carolleeae]|eukprot:XP_023349472.1 meckelin-like [Eurytemora affinis]
MVSLVAIILLVIPAQGLEINMFRFDKPDSCSQNSSYNSVMLSCVVCPPGSRRVSVENNFYTNGECRCMPGYFTTQDTGYYMGDSRDRQGGLGLQCSKCKHGFVSSEDGRMCLECENGVDPGIKME